MDAVWTVLIQYCMCVHVWTTFLMTRADLLLESCNFDTDFCQWTPLEWQLCTEEDGCSTTIPKSSWKGGFAYVKPPISGHNNRFPQLFCPTIAALNVELISFRYYLSHPETFLTLTNNFEEVWNTSNSTPDHWQEEHINISIFPSTSTYNLKFEVNKLTGIIAIDYVQIANKECIDSPITFTTLDKTTSLHENAARSSDTSKTTGIIVGVVLGIAFIVGLVTFLWCFITRSKHVRRKYASHDKQILSIDSTEQSVALPGLLNSTSTNDGYTEIQTKYDNYQHVNSHSINTSGQNYAKLDHLNNLSGNKAGNILHENGATNVPGVNMLNEEINKSNEYAVIDPNDDHSNGNDDQIKFTVSTPGNYAVLDPKVTGFYRSQGNNETTTEYDLAVPINDNECVSDQHDPYSVSENGTYDSTNNARHKEGETNIYNHAVENVYDTSSHDRKIVDNAGTYDHFFGDKTEDNYNISKRE